jgi:hypothetical protein
MVTELGIKHGEHGLEVKARDPGRAGDGRHPGFVGRQLVGLDLDNAVPVLPRPPAGS